MKIQEITSITRRDFYAIYICEHCGTTEKAPGYDDNYFHSEVVPNMVCKTCGKKAPKSYISRETRYPEGLQV